LQGYDSVAVQADVELGGTDQKFNVAMGRDLQRHFDQRPQFGLLLPILAGLDGIQKMSKSLGNTVGLNEDPLSMYSKLEKIPDLLVNSYLTLLTELDLNALPVNPRERQKAMALAVTASRHGMPAAIAAQSDAATLIAGSQDLAADVPEALLSAVNFPAKAFYLLSAIGLCASSSEARRQIKGGAVRLDGEKITDPNMEFTKATLLSGKVLQLGKKTFRRLKA
jgi:tyrosyl-tRNA synthetase